MKLFKDQLARLNKNLNTLREREAKFGGNAPIDLLNMIDDHLKAIDLIQKALSEKLTHAELEAELSSLNIDHLRFSFDHAGDSRHDFYHHVPFPANYVPRPDLIADVKAALLTTTDSFALTSAAIKMDALHGMGGIGKSVMARVLCDDLDIQATFSDGILWTTLGQSINESELQTKLREWIDTLGGVISEDAPTLDKLKAMLAKLLQEQACLLILDDVWKREDAEIFRVGGPRCRLLLTTRDTQIAQGLGATVKTIPTMTPSEAVTLLEEWAGHTLSRTTYADLKAKIVKRLGYLPLAIKLAGAQLQRKDPVAWLQTFDFRKLKARRPETPHDSLVTTFALSLEDLSDIERQLYIALAIFKEDEATPTVAIPKLWSALSDLDKDEATDLLYDLNDRALLQLNPAPDIEANNENLSTPDPYFILHDLLREFITVELGNEGRIGAHQALLEAYRLTRDGEGWATAPDDGYLYDHLAYHLGQLADFDPTADTDLKSLFIDQTWLQARVPQSNYEYDGYIADLMLVWHRAHAESCNQIEANQTPTALAECVRYALLRTSINSIARNYAPELVGRAVEVGLWSPKQALSTAAKIYFPDSKAQVYSQLLRTGKLTPEQESEAQTLGLEIALTTSTKDIQAKTLAELATNLPEDKRILALQSSLDAVMETHYGTYFNEALEALIPQLEGELLEKALEDTLSSEG